MKLTRAVLQSQIHVVQQSAVMKFAVSSTAGFQVPVAGTTSQSLQLAFCQGKFYYALGGGALTLFGDIFSTGTSLVNIFDQWRLRKVDVELSYSRNSQQSTNQQSQPMLYSVVDYDDYLALGSTQIALGFANCRCHQLGQGNESGGPFHRFSVWKPCFQNSVGIAAGGAISGGVDRYKWMDTATPDIPHYGVKFFLDNPEATNAIIGYITIIMRGVYEYKNLR